MFLTRTFFSTRNNSCSVILYRFYSEVIDTRGQLLFAQLIHVAHTKPIEKSFIHSKTYDGHPLALSNKNPPLTALEISFTKRRKTSTSSPKSNLILLGKQSLLSDRRIPFRFHPRELHKET